MDSQKAQGDVVRILYEKGKGGAIAFPTNELKIFLALLKGLYKSMPADFIKEAIADVENDMKPQQLPFINYFHWCKSCGRDLDERDENSICITRDGDAEWKHKSCPPLKTNRPI